MIIIVVLSLFVSLTPSLFCKVDTTPPTIHNCPNIVTKVIPLQQNGTFVSWDALEVTDNSERFILRIEPEIQSNYFTTGLTEVQYIYTDLSGNSASCFVNIHVIERKYMYCACAQWNAVNAVAHINCSPTYVVSRGLLNICLNLWTMLIVKGTNFRGFLIIDNNLAVG